MIRLIEKAAKHPNYTKRLIMGAPDSKLAADAAQFYMHSQQQAQPLTTRILYLHNHSAVGSQICGAPFEKEEDIL